jgi:hypothetical protein
LRERVRVRVAQKLPLILTFSPEGRRNPLYWGIAAGPDPCSLNPDP